MNIYEIIAKAQALKDEKKIDSVSPSRVGALIEDTLKYINEYQLLSSSPTIHKTYASVSAMQADAAPVSDLTGKAMKKGQLVVIVPTDSSDTTAGDVYRYDGPSGNTSAWTFISKIGGIPADAQLSATSTNPVQNAAVTAKLTELEGYYESVFALTAGGYHSSTKDRIEINRAIKAGEKYILRGELIGASVVNYSLSVVYADSTNYETVGTYRFGADVVLTAPKDIISMGFYIEGISASGNVSMQVTTSRYSVLSNLRYELLPAEEGHTLIPNINTADGTMTMQGALMIDGIPYYVNDKTFNIKGGVISSAVVVVFNKISQEFYSKAYDTRISLDEIIIGTARVNYSVTGEYKYLVRASFPFDYTIDGKHLTDAEINEVKSLIVEINPPSTFKGSFALTAGGYHSSTQDRIEINGAIKAGEKYILRGNLEEGAVVAKNTFQAQVVYADSTDYINIGDFPYYQNILLTAPKDIVSIGFYVEGISISGKSVMTITRVSGNIQNAEISSLIPADYTWEKYMDISGVQGSCVHDDILFAFNAASNGSLEANVYNLSEKSFIQALTFAGMAVANTHANSVGFGRKYAESDEFPLLYISSGYPISGTADTQVYCYRIQGSLGSLAATLIQTITLRGFGTWTEGVVDGDHERLWVKYHSNDYECHNLPAVSDGDVVINQGAEVIDSISLDGVHFPPYVAGSSPQGHYYHKGKLIYVSGIPYTEGAESCFLSVINLRGHSRESVIWLEDVGLTNGGINNLYEPEGVFFWRGELYITFKTFVAKIKIVA